MNFWKESKMLSNIEKQEILQDARNPKRRDAFRQTRVAQALPSFDAYLKFLNCVQQTFSQTVSSVPNQSLQYFKL